MPKFTVAYTVYLYNGVVDVEAETAEDAMDKLQYVDMKQLVQNVEEAEVEGHCVIDEKGKTILEVF